MADAAEKKKPGLALLIGVGKAKASGKATADDESESEDAGEYDASLDELADVLDVAAEKRDAFMDAFKAAVMSCK